MEIFPPTDQAEEVRKELTADLDNQLQRLDNLLYQKIKLINAKGKNLGIQIISDRTSRIGTP